MAKSEKQIEMENYIRSVIEEMTKNPEGSMIGMMSPKFVSCSYDDQTLTVLFELKPWMRNPVGILHGGVTAAMLDNAMGMLAKYYTADHRFAPTVNMSVDYIKQIAITETVVVKASILSAGSTLIRTRGEVRLSGKTGLAGSGIATYFAGGF